MCDTCAVRPLTLSLSLLVLVSTRERPGKEGRKERSCRLCAVCFLFDRIRVRACNFSSSVTRCYPIIVVYCTSVRIHEEAKFKSGRKHAILSRMNHTHPTAARTYYRINRIAISAVPFYDI